MRLQVIGVVGRKRTHHWWRGDLDVVLFAVRAAMAESGTQAVFVVQDALGNALATIQPSPEWIGVYVTSMADGRTFRHLLELVNEDPTLDAVYEQTDIDNDTFRIMSAVRSDLRTKGGCIIV